MTTVNLLLSPSQGLTLQDKFNSTLRNAIGSSSFLRGTLNFFDTFRKQPSIEYSARRESFPSSSSLGTIDENNAL